MDKAKGMPEDSGVDVLKLDRFFKLAGVEGV